MKQQHPDRQECLRLLKEYGTPEHVIRHCMAVADTAVRIGRALNEHGYHLDLELNTGKKATRWRGISVIIRKRILYESI